MADGVLDARFCSNPVLSLDTKQILRSDSKESAFDGGAGIAESALRQIRFKETA
jgi:hypothetical protein